jgi:hypothetical protein
MKDKTKLTALKKISSSGRCAPMKVPKANFLGAICAKLDVLCSRIPTTDRKNIPTTDRKRSGPRTDGSSGGEVE